MVRPHLELAALELTAWGSSSLKVKSSQVMSSQVGSNATRVSPAPGQMSARLATENFERCVGVNISRVHIWVSPIFSYRLFLSSLPACVSVEAWPVLYCFVFTAVLLTCCVY
jgi:hypothetical protein